MITIEYFLLFCCLQSDSSNFEKHEMQGVSKYQKCQVILKKSCDATLELCPTF